MIGAALGALAGYAAARRQGRNRLMAHALGSALLAAFMAAVFSVTGVSPVSGFHIGLRPDGLNLVPFAGIRAVSHSGFNSYAVRNILGNILLFLPLGFLTPALFSRWRSLLKVTLLGLGTSLLIECTQLFLIRGTDVDDLLLNTLGTALGYGLYRFIALLRRGSGRTARLDGALPPLLCVALPYLAVVLLGFLDRAACFAL